APKVAKAADTLATLVQKLTNVSGLKGGVLQFNVRDPESVWTLDLGANPPQLASGSHHDAAAVATISDDALAELVAGTRELRSLYQKGDLRVDGDIALVRQIEQAL